MRLRFTLPKPSKLADRHFTPEYPDLPLIPQPEVDGPKSPLWDCQDPPNGPGLEEERLEPHAREVLRPEPPHAGVSLALCNDELLFASFPTVAQEVRPVGGPGHPPCRREEGLLLHGVVLPLELPPDDRLHPPMDRGLRHGVLLPVGAFLAEPRQV